MFCPYAEDVHLCPYVNLNQPLPMFAPTCLSQYFKMHAPDSSYASASADSGRLMQTWQRLIQVDVSDACVPHCQML